MNAPIDPQLTWDREDAVHRLNRLQHLRMQLAAAEQAVTSCRAAYARASAEEKRLRAELYAQLEIETTPDLFTPRGQQVEDNLCSACQHQATDEGKVMTDMEKVLEQASDADAEEQADPLAHDCPQCGAQPGERCRSSKGKGCAPHRQRGKPQKPEPAEDASLFEQALDGHPWPDWLISDVIGHANIVDRFPSKSLTKPISVRPISWDNRLWVYVGGIWGAGKGSWDKAELLSLIPAAEFEERYVSIPTKFQPKLPADPTAEDRRQYYTGVVVKVGRKEFAIAPASEGRTVVRRKEQS